MMKKLISLMLCMAMALSLLVLPSFAAEDDIHNYEIKDGLAFVLDCEDGVLDILPPKLSGNATDDVLVTEHTEDNGNTYWEMTPIPERTYYNYAFMDNRLYSDQFADMLLPGAIITFDLKCETEGLPFWVMISRPEGDAYRGAKKDFLSVGINGRADGNWYTYKIEVGDYTGNTSFETEAASYTVSKKLRDDENSEFEVMTKRLTTGFPYKEDLQKTDYSYISAYGSGPVNTPNCIHIGYIPYKVRNNVGRTDVSSEGQTIFTKDDVNATTYYFDNFMVASIPGSVIASDAGFKSNDNEITELPENGTIIPVFETRSTVIPSAGATSINALYDKNGNMVSMNTEAVLMNFGLDETEGAAIDAADVPEGGKIEAMLWNSLDAMQPIAPNNVLGSATAVEGTSVENISTYANTITIEGMADANEVVTLMAVDSENDTVLAVTQFNATSDGSFKKTIALNPELLDENSVVEIKTAGVDKEPETISVPIETNWNQMLADFRTLDENNALNFFEEYADNFNTYSNGAVVEDAIIDVLSDEQLLLAGFLASTRVYSEDLSCAEMFGEIFGFVKTVTDGKMDEFMAAFRAAKAADSHETVCELIRNTTFVTFNLEGFFNLNDIAKALLISETENIETDFTVFWNEYEELATAQVAKEQAIVPKFTDTSITNGTSLKNVFFEGRADTDNDGADDTSIKTILGITAEYNKDDYDVMYTLYDHFDYEECDSFEKAYSAIVFLMSYADEYKTWTAEIEKPQTVTAEWTSISKVFGELEYVTAELADMYVSKKNEPVIYDRLEDLGFENLIDARNALNGEDAEDISEEITAKLTCIDDIHSAANDPYGSKGEKGYSGWVKKEVEEAEKNGWIDVSGKLRTSSAVYEKMTEKTYRYLSDIQKYYEAAVEEVEENKNSGSGGSSGGGSGSGFGSTVNGSDGKITTGAGTSIEADEKSVVIGGMTSDKTNVDLNGDGHPVAPFKDVTENYAWAKEQISTLREYGIVSGDGDGSFRPGDSISREEFLAILLRVFDVEFTGSNSGFADVDENAWYAKVVATATDLGIVKGFPDGRFGIGEDVLRADMAVMLVRTLNVMNVDIATEEKGYVFTDYADIPHYAYDAVVELQQAGLVQGDEYRNYKPLDRLTRAESAVALCAIFKQLGNMHFYSWNSTLFPGNYAN